MGWSISLLTQSGPKAEASFADICTHLDAEFQGQKKAATLKAWGRPCHMKCKIQRAKGPTSQAKEGLQGNNRKKQKT